MFEPLKGVKVIDLTYFVAGPGTARILADWGADVIKVEPPFGDPGRGTGATMSMPADNNSNPFYSAYNANKKGVALNLKTEEGKSILGKMLDSADVFVSSYRTGALKRLGLDYETLHKQYPRLVWAQINGFGDFGPAKDKPGFDTVAYWARSGTMMDIPNKGSGPINPPIGFGDATTASSLAGGICAALYQRMNTNEGCKVMISLFSQAIWGASCEIASTQYADVYPKSRAQDATSPVINAYECSDGEWIFLSILEPDRYNNILFKALGRDDLVDHPKFATAAASKANCQELTEILNGEFAKHTRDEMVQILTDVDIAHEKIQHFEDVWKDPQAIDNRYVIPTKNFDGTTTWQAASPIRFAKEEPKTVDDIDPTFKCQAPRIGQDTVEVLKDYGYTQEEIDGFVEKGAAAVYTG